MTIWAFSNCAVVARASVFSVSPVASATRCRLIRRSFMVTILISGEWARCGGGTGLSRRKRMPQGSRPGMAKPPTKRQIRLNAFDMACVGHIQHGMWTHPRDHSADYTSLDHWVSLARTLERGLFDGLFLADILGAYDVLEGTPAPSLRASVQIPLLDPMALVPAMAHATTHLGFGVTCNLAYEAPFLFARRIATLDHLTRR